MVSKRLIHALKLAPRRMYQIAWEADVHPTTLSKIVNGIQRVKRGDPRILRLGKVLEIPEEELFESCERD